MSRLTPWRTSIRLRCRLIARAAPRSASANTASSDSASIATSPGARNSTRLRCAPRRFLSRSMWSSSSAAGGPSNVRGRPCRSSSPTTSSRTAGSSPVTRSETRRATSRPSADRLAVAPPPVAGGRLERVRERVAEVQRGPEAGVALVRRDDAQLRARAALDHAGHGRQVALDHGPQRRQRAHVLPQAPARDQRRLHDLGEARAQLLAEAAFRARPDRSAPRRAGGTRRRSSCPPAGPRRSCLRRRSRPVPRSSSGRVRPQPRAGMWLRRSPPDLRPRRLRGRRSCRSAACRHGPAPAGRVPPPPSSCVAHRTALSAWRRPGPRAARRAAPARPRRPRRSSARDRRAARPPRPPHRPPPRRGNPAPPRSSGGRPGRARRARPRTPASSRRRRPAQRWPPTRTAGAGRRAAGRSARGRAPAGGPSPAHGPRPCRRPPRHARRRGRPARRGPAGARGPRRRAARSPGPAPPSSSSTSSCSRSRNASSPSRSKNDAIGSPRRSSSNLSESASGQPSRCAASRPSRDFPAHMKPTMTSFRPPAAPGACAAAAEPVARPYLRHSMRSR